nr:phosphoenolpyruvate carboxylase [Haloterrigena salina]
MVIQDKFISHDIRELGALLGTILEEQTSRETFETVESCRQAAIDYRSGDLDTRDPLITELEGLSSHNQRIVARAFTTYFELINLAEVRAGDRTDHGNRATRSPPHPRLAR